MKFNIIVSLILFSFCSTTLAQTNCVGNLNRAQQSFDAGHLYEIPEMLEGCIKRGFNKTQKIQAYLLLTRTYLFIDDPQKVEESYLNILKLDPEFTVSEDRDPIDLVYLSKNFTTTPIFVLYARAGVNLSSAVSIQNFGVDNTSNSLEEYSSKPGFHFGAGGELNLTNHFSLGIELNFIRRSYAYQNVLFEGDVQDFQENQALLEPSVFIKYRHDFNKFYPFAYAGFSPSYLLSANGELDLLDRTKTDLTGENSTVVPVSGPAEPLDNLRNSINRAVFIGGGFNYKVGYNYLTFDLRYARGLSNIVDPEGQYGNSTLLYKFGYVDDDKRINSVMISVGYVYPLYKPRKIKKGNTKNFLKSIFDRKK